MSQVFIKMGEGLESNCNLSGKPIQAGTIAEVSQADAAYVCSMGLGKRLNAEEIKEHLKATGREKEIPKPEPKAESEPVKKPEVEPKQEAKPVEKPKKAKSKGSLDDMSFGELKKLADAKEIRITKAKGRITKSDLIAAIKAKKGK